MSDAYAVWRKMTAKKPVELADYLPTMGWENSRENPQPGLYKTKLLKGGFSAPVRIWLTSQSGDIAHSWTPDCAVHAMIGGSVVDRTQLAERWMWCEAVTKQDFAHYEANKCWPGEIPEAGHNSGALSLPEEIDDAAETALSWLSKNTIADKVSADICANHRARLLDLAKKADKQRETEKRPHDEAAKAVQTKWKPVIERADTAAQAMRAALTQWMVAEENRQRAEAEAKRRAAEEEARKARAAAEAERQAAIAAMPAAERPAVEELPEPELPIVVAEPIKVQAGGQRGRKAGLREVTRYVVTDHAAALAFFANAEAVKELVQKLAEQASKAGATVPGVEKRVEKVAA